MHGLINRALENFLKQRHGLVLWKRVVERAQLPFDSFEPLLTYDPAFTDRVIAVACDELNQSHETLLEDMGTALVSHRDRDGLRRLLRFGGISFRDFLHSLEELPDRARLALPDLYLPELRLEERAAGQFALMAAPPFEGAGFILMGLLRAMADDYGALVLLDITPTVSDVDVISIYLLDESHAEGRRFALSAGAP
ncbi:MAG: heme NO-binding domain-containing protein [Pseudotabrizicola sp.]|uniref:heme NO-binding domain-containing protein n=1 Tax=Pseudotabrizicola sp. TaxID=2939647 RepID=UPI0027277764|nr:heme NO-binding domain-containing protein [Pseudotabrizicola sp.]MDO8882888.1 heme NO-binding domain-containing protein [Pseudotabrizicola sp.]MDP2081455.1 heme NO-binding domain-containing protein [Pseudotabrizicola sp.]MDZ7572968.1 heme NO-binding domain-containing protein [Pseudotabrizicola sp.]